MVLGEASESDDSDDNAPTEFSNSTAINFGQSTTAETTSANNKTSRRHKLKYNTLLHYKLRIRELYFTFLLKLKVIIDAFNIQVKIMLN